MVLMNNRVRDDNMEQHRFHPAVAILVPLIAVFFQAYLPLRFPRFAVLDLPLIITVYFSVSRRNPISGTFLGTGIGILQDALTHLPLGINGVIKALVGYLAASIGMRIDVDNPGTRLMMMFFFSLLSSLLHVFIVRHLLDMAQAWYFLHEFIRALVNSLVAIILFALLDRLRKRE